MNTEPSSTRYAAAATNLDTPRNSTELLRNLYRTVAPHRARTYLKSWCAKANRSHIAAFQTLAKRLTNHFEAVVASVELGLSNSRLEGTNSKIRVIQRRGYGHPQPNSLTTMIHLSSAESPSHHPHKGEERDS